MSDTKKKNRLKFSRAYLVGPMDHDRESGRQWREDLSQWLLEKLQVIVFDPYNKPLHDIHRDGLEDDDNYFYRELALETERWELMREYMKPVVATDLRMVDNVDFLIVNLDIEKHPCGTFDECFTADNQNKPVIIYCPQGKSKIYHWLWGRLKPELFFDDWDDVKAYLEHVAFAPDDEIDCLDRWKFFDIENLILDVVKQEYLLLPLEKYKNELS